MRRVKIAFKVDASFAYTKSIKQKIEGNWEPKFISAQHVTEQDFLTPKSMFVHHILDNTHHMVRQIS